MNCQRVWLCGVFAVALLGACVDEASVGKEQCLGANTSCTAPLARYIANGVPVEISSGALSVLKPVWSKTLELPEQVWDTEPKTMPPDRGRLVGGGPEALWVMRARADGGALQLFRLSPDGDVTEQDELAAPDPVLDRSLPLEERVPEGAVLLSFSRPLTQSAPGPIVQAVWVHPCDGSHSAPQHCSLGEVVSLSDAGKAPARYLDNSGEAAFSQAAGGGIWRLSDVLAKLGTDGQVEIQQTQVGLVPNLDQLWHQPAALQPMASYLSGGVALATWLYNEEFQRTVPELWRLDADGNVSFRAMLSTVPKGMTSLVDSQGRWVLALTLDGGDLELARVDTERSELRDVVRVYREGYPDLTVWSATLDAADNVYILSETGSRTSGAATVCRYPAEGDTTCLLVPELSSDQDLVGGAAGVFYATPTAVAETPEGPSNTTTPPLTLQRYEWPEP